MSLFNVLFTVLRQCLYVLIVSSSYVICYTCMTKFSFYHPFLCVQKMRIIFLNSIYMSRNVCTGCNVYNCCHCILYCMYVGGPLKPTMTPVCPRLLNMIADFVLLRF